MTLDDLFDRTYDRVNYNCAHFVSEAWPVVTGQGLPDAFAGFLLPPSDRTATLPQRASFERLSDPASPCLVLMDRPGATPHVGIWYNGKVLHLTELGVNYQPLDVANNGFSKTRFYRCKPLP